MDYTRQSRYSDPREYAPLLTALPSGLPELAAVIRNVVVHYRGAGIDFPGERLQEIDSRWVDRILAQDQRRHPQPLAGPRALEERVVSCCRDCALLTVAALRARGVPARSRVGFAAYFHEDFHGDHVITEWHDGSRWIAADTELDPAGEWGFDPLDLPLGPGGLVPAAQVWQQYRRGEINIDTYGVFPGDRYGGAWFVRNYVLQEVAHRYGDEMLLWDGWGAMSAELDGDLSLIDEVAALLRAADAGDDTADRHLERWYHDDDRLHPGDKVTCHSPRGVTSEIDLTR